MPDASLLRRFDRCRPSSTNSTAAATAAGDSSPPVSWRHRRRRAGTCSTSAASWSLDDVLAGVGDDTLLEGGDDVAGLLGLDALLEHGEHRALDEVLEDRPLAPVVERLDLDLADRAGGERVEVVDAGDDRPLPGPQPAAQRVGGERFVVARRSGAR